MTPTLRNILIPILIIIAFVGVALGIANYRKQISQRGQQTQDQTAPDVTLNSPQDQEKISANEIAVKGETAPENKVNVDGREVMVGQDGFFETVSPLNQRENKVVVTVTDPAGNQTVVERTVIREGFVAQQPDQLSQTGPEHWLIAFALFVLTAHWLKKSSETSIVSSLKKY